MISSWLAAYLAVVQVLFFLGWTVYAAYLPRLLDGAGLDPSWTPAILILDQLIFLVSDVLLGAVSDAVERWLGRLGLLIAGLSLGAGGLFALMPILGVTHEAALLGLIVLWAFTSSALRGPPMVLLARHAATPRRPWLIAVSLCGVAVGGAVSPYLGTALSLISPVLPFLMSGLVLAATTLGLVLVDIQRRRTPLPAASAPVGLLRRSQPIELLVLGASSVLVAAGFQLHFFVNSAPQYLQFAEPDTLGWLMPVFWIGFNLGLFPAAAAAKRLGGATIAAAGGLLGGAGALLCPLLPALPLLIGAQLVAGAGWGAFFMAGISAALALGGRGFEGLTLGSWFATLSAAAAARIALKISGAAALAPLLFSMSAGALWLLGALLLCGLAAWQKFSA